MWNDILGHEQNKEFLAKLLQPGKRPHAVLFLGPEGIGKKTLALHFAKTNLCLSESAPCGVCESCRLFNLEEHSFAHPDFILVEQEAPGKDLKIEQIKDISKQAAFAPILSKNKICIIDAADKMTVEAANSLLKLLEEPPDNWFFILVASRAETLLATILSRVVQLRFEQLPISVAQEALERRGVQDAPLLARLASGSLGLALNLAQQNVLDYRNQAITTLLELPLKAPLQYLAKQSWLESYDKQSGLLFTELVIFLLRDALFWKNSLQEQIYNCDRKESVASLASSRSEDQLIKAAKTTQEAYQAIDSNSSVKLVLEMLILKIDNLWKEEKKCQKL